ncbi:unnamed protein product [Bursaphelenchus xylophilus]|uniref:(pine wood nematode) hypothetical protein n=1 Tax=Bursaphelenchus xylophilus TaxID=6326 RepID=A0A1I7SDD9_BURXY|nr:unnamed protein product [Bursaphelenchus xylophilus]CAG9130625.1 unnamed protein product [Bursaphelenchus xylophilus]
MARREHPVRVLGPDDYNKSFQEVGKEEVHTVEAFETKIHGKNIEPKRSFSTKSFIERRTFGRDENGDLVVKIENNPKDPVRPVSPVRLTDGNEEKTLRPLPNLETTPLHIPRVGLKGNGKRSPSIQWRDQISPESSYRRSSPQPTFRRPSPSFGRPSPQPSHHSGRSSGFSSGSNNSEFAASVPMKKITKKSRLVNIFDGRPMSDYEETVHFVPVDRPPSRWNESDDLYGYRNRGVNLEQNSRVSRFDHGMDVTQNPYYSDY